MRYISRDSVALMAQRLDDCARASKKPPNSLMETVRDILWSLPMTKDGWPNDELTEEEIA